VIIDRYIKDHWVNRNSDVSCTCICGRLGDENGGQCNLWLPIDCLARFLVVM